MIFHITTLSRKKIRNTFFYFTRLKSVPPLGKGHTFISPLKKENSEFLSLAPNTSYITNCITGREPSGPPRLRKKSYLTTLAIRTPAPYRRE